MADATLFPNDLDLDCDSTRAAWTRKLSSVLASLNRLRLLAGARWRLSTGVESLSFKRGFNSGDGCPCSPAILSTTRTESIAQMSSKGYFGCGQGTVDRCSSAPFCRVSPTPLKKDPHQGLQSFRSLYLAGSRPCWPWQSFPGRNGCRRGSCFARWRALAWGWGQVRAVARSTLGR